jgi:hypothetical protein
MMDWGESSGKDEAGNYLYPDKKLVASYEGCVIETREMNGYHDSDFYAVIWDEEEQRIREVEYATTRAYTYDNSAHVDITPENMEKVNEYARGIVLHRLLSANESQAKEVDKGKWVRVVKGRKVPKGTEGRVFWIGPGFSRYSSARIGIALDEEKDERGRYGNVAWTSAGNCEVMNWETYLKPEEEIREYVRKHRNPYELMRATRPMPAGWIRL